MPDYHIISLKISFSQQREIVPPGDVELEHCALKNSGKIYILKNSLHALKIGNLVHPEAQAKAEEARRRHVPPPPCLNQGFAAGNFKSFIFIFLHLSFLRIISFNKRRAFLSPIRHFSERLKRKST